MKEVFKLTSLEQVKVLAHPLRVKLLEAFACKPRTAKQVAETLGQRPTKLYHHVEILEHAGLLKLVKTRKKRGTLEKYYRTVANQFSVDSRLFRMQAGGKEVLGEFQIMFASMLENTLSEVNESIAAKLIRPESESGQATAARTHIRTTPEEIMKLERKIRMLLKEFDSAKRKKGGVEYGLTLIFYPVFKKKKGR